jgi:hypothetical protein
MATVRPEPAKAQWNVLLIITPLAIVAAGWFFQAMWGWIIVMVLLGAFVLLTGKQILHVWRGALVDERNMVSLSRFQTVLWTVLVVSAFLVAAFHNVRTGQEDPLAINVPSELYILLGVSVTSLVGSGLIKQDKANTTPDIQTASLDLQKSGKLEPLQKVELVGNRMIAAPSATAEDHVPTLAASGPVQASEQAAPPASTQNPGLGSVVDPAATLARPALGPTENSLVGIGVLSANDKPNQSSWLDMFRTEEIGAIGRLSLAKIQMLYFTITIVVIYAAAIASMLAGNSGKITSLPQVTESAAILLGISHATYLAGKAVPRTSTARPNNTVG